MLLTNVSGVFGQTPAQMPLLTKAGAAVAPNVVLTLDDSGSMQFQHMPETRFAVENPVTTNPVGGNQVRWDPNDNYQTGWLKGTVPGNLASTNYVLKAQRSPDTNTIFYNPEIRYYPWMTSDGVTRLPNSPVDKAYRNPLVRTGAAGTYIDLTATSPNGTYAAGTFVTGITYKIVVKGTTNWIAIGSANNNVGTSFVATGAGSGTGTASTGTMTGWCYGNATNYTGTATGASTDGCGPVTANFVHDPGAYFRLNKVAGAYQTVTDQANYTGYTINAPAATTYTKYAARTDCLGTACTRDEERQNYANWFSYYRTRNLLARGSLMDAFGVEPAPVSAGTFSIGTRYAIVSVGTTSFTSIGAASNTVDTVFTATGAGSGNGTARAISMRLGFGRINKGSASVDGVNTTVLESNTATYGGGGVREFNFARKANLFKWLEDLPANSGTPLVTALESVGKYYARTDTQGPWTDNPAVNTNVVANNKTCRRSYNIMTTDGYWNGAAVSVGNQDNTDGATITGSGQSYIYRASSPYKDTWSNTLADVAMKYWKTDLQPSTTNAVPAVADNTSFWQNMTVFTVGLGVKGTLDPAADLPALTTGTKTWPEAKTGAAGPNVDDLWHAAVNSRGKYFSAKDPQELSAAIRTALAGASGGSGATAGVATASTVLSDNNRKYVPTFTAGSWAGDIASYPLDSDGQILSAVWHAADRMPPYNGQTWSGRNIVTWDPSTWSAVPFAWASLSTASKTALGSLAATYTTQFIDFLWGDHSKEGTGNPFRTRLDSAGKPFILGDIVNSNPVLIQGNFDGVYSDAAWGGKSAYDAFKATKLARTAVLFAGANDGMLHAFKDSKALTAASEVSDGQEVFAYVPRSIYPNLSKLADKNYGTTVSLQHQYYVDGPLREADAFVKAPGASSASWRNYLMGSLGAGGRAVFALDVTNSMSMGPSNVRWELSSDDDSDIGYVLSPIKVGVTPNGRWIAVFGNGYSSTGFSASSGNAVLFVVDIEDAASSNAAVRAAAIQKVTLDNTGNNGLGGVTLIPDSATGRTTSIYAGDLKGNFWKVKYDTATGTYIKDGANALFTAADSLGNAQPITSSPVVYNHSMGGRMVVFGTGKLFATADGNDTSGQSVYGVWEKPSDSVTRPLARANLAARTLASFSGSGAASGTTFFSSTGATVDYSGSERGWFIDISSAITGGRVIYPSQVVGYSTALVSSVAPVQGTPAACDSGTGTAVNLLVPVETGTNEPTYRVFDTDGDGIANGSDLVGMGYQTRADGVDAVVSSASASGSSNRMSDVGGGGPEGDCTGALCSKKGKKCVPDARCAAGTCLSSIQSATMGLPVCIPIGSGGQRVWRRIINPPIR
jgi:type IV pilus assembly protein PilY1